VLSVKSIPEPIRALVVDDSRTARELLIALLEATEGIEVVGAGGSGEDAIRLARRLRPAVITMDVRMPTMDGLEATQRIMREVPTPIVIVTASVMRADMDLSYEALRAGALTVVKKPGLADPQTGEELVRAVRLMSGVPVVRRWDGVGRGSRAGDPLGGEVETAREREARTAASAPGPAGAVVLADVDRVRVIGVVASTGGPGTLAAILGELPPDFPLPILVVQHITSGFAVGLAEWLDKQTPLRVALASHGSSLEGGGVLLAPDDYHMQVNARGEVELYRGEPYKGLRPSANHLFHSLAQTYASEAMGIVLTGMGDDGVEGLKAVHDAGGLTVAQDRQNCVVYGMPGEAVARGAVDQVLSVGQIAPLLAQIAHRRVKG
jgi:two-component system chemotaxis response regulator CheB